MLLEIHPKLPMRDKNATKEFYLNQLEFSEIEDYGNYLMIRKDHIEIHFFEHRQLDPAENDGQVYIRTSRISDLYESLAAKQISIYPNGALETKPWGQQEFSLLDPDNNLLTFGQSR